MTDVEDLSSPNVDCECSRARHGVVVGIDGGPGSDAALQWALANAGDPGPVQPVFAWHYPNVVWVPAGLGGYPAPSVELMQADAERVAESALRGLDRSCRNESIVACGYAGMVLTGIAADAEMLVVGTRGHGKVASHLLGSIGRYCANHTTVPLVIVPEPDREHTVPRTIVVGVDGSENGDAALRWAIEFAAAQDTIRAVKVWKVIVDTAYSLPPTDPRGIKKAGRGVIDDAVDRASEATGIDDDRVMREVIEGDPHRVLRDLQCEADLLVVGARGRTGFSHFVIGSTTSSLLHRARCPIAVIPHC